jgi:hypothetical protein
MDKYHLHWFTDEIHIHASSAIASYKHMLHLLSERATFQSRDVWFALVSFLTHVAMISKFLDPIHPNETKENRGATLRAHLNVSDDSPIFPRTSRDNLEHFDERIDRWVQTGQNKILEMVFHDRAGFEYLADGNYAIRRVLIADELVFISEDRNGQPVELELRPVYEALQTLWQACVEKLKTESPYSYHLAEAVRNYKRPL